METKANTTLIGAFTLVVLALAFGFIYWLARGHETSAASRMSIVFSDPVTGLGTGGQVVFNGIKVGDVQRLRLDPNNPARVIADVGVARDTPIKTDTVATLGFQGLTGVGYIELQGGTASAPSIWTMDPPVIEAQRSSMQDLLAGARNILARADDTLKALEGLVSDNREPVNQAVRNVASFTGALADSSDEVTDLLRNASEASQALSSISSRLEALVDRTEAVMAAVDPADIRQTISNVQTFTSALSARTEDIDALVTRLSAISSDVSGFTARLGGLGDKADTLMTDVAAAGQRVSELVQAVDAEAVNRSITRVEEITAAVDPAQVRSAVDSFASVAEAIGARRDDIDGIVTRLSAISSDVSGFTARLGGLGDRADTLMTDVAAAGQRVSELVEAVDAEAVNRSIARVEEITAAVDPAQVRSAVDSFASVAEAIGARRDDIDGIVTRLSAISSDVSGFTARLGTFGDKADALMTDVAAAGERVNEIAASVDTEALRRTIARVDEIAASVDPARVRSTVDSVASVAEAFGARREEIDDLVTRISAISVDVGGFAARLPTMGARVDDLLAAVDAQKVRESVDGVHEFADALGRNSGNIDAIVADARAVSGRLNGLSERADALLAKLDGMIGEGSGDGIMTQARETLAAVQQAARTFDQQTRAIGGGVDDFTNRGLRDLRSLINEGQRAVSRLDSVISNLERDPSQVLFGPDAVPEYRGSRRR